MRENTCFLILLSFPLSLWNFLHNDPVPNLFPALRKNKFGCQGKMPWLPTSCHMASGI